MQTYLVGGAVRDKLLGLPVQDRDYVVVGATPEQMIARGFKPVGADFPVFLHPETREEYALARTERKAGHGYKGFKVYAAPDVTLEDDLRRRDLTINAMAEDEAGHLVDPYGGAADLRDGLLRHVSEAFAEDPVRILRVARFAARYAPRGFRVADETLALMRSMVKAGEADHLVAERVWAELERALGEERPSAFFWVLRSCGALARLFPEIDRLIGVPQPSQHHPEVDTGVHVMLVLDAAARLSPDPRVRFAALVHDLGKSETPAAEWPKHVGHEKRGAELVKALCERFRVPNEYRDLGVIAARFHALCHRVAVWRNCVPPRWSIRSRPWMPSASPRVLACSCSHARPIFGGARGSRTGPIRRARCFVRPSMPHGVWIRRPWRAESRTEQRLAVAFAKPASPPSER